MATSSSTTGGPRDIAILARLLGNGAKNLPPALARYILSVEFDEEDKARMHELAIKNQSDCLSVKEREELEGYARAGCLLGILQSKARKSLKRDGRKKPS
jgi:hypothetical protein